MERLQYTEGGDERHLKRLAIVADLKRAVARDELTLHFQPKVSLADGVARSCEALVRWIHPEHGFMPPDEFIGLAESSGNISLLTDWVLGSAIDHAAEWRERGHRHRRRGQPLRTRPAGRLAAGPHRGDAQEAPPAALLADPRGDREPR